jgi:ADP-heptose:LPS heptosyltransferase
MDNPKAFLLSRTDSIGDMFLTLPMAGLLKKIHPGCKVFVLGKNYTRPVVESAQLVDGFIDLATLPSDPNACADFLNGFQITHVIHVFPVKELAFLLAKTGKVRIGTMNRWYLWLTCNQLIRLSRKNSPYHESQLNALLLKRSGLLQIPSLTELAGHLALQAPEMDEMTASFLSKDKTNIILHPKSKGSAKEWGIKNYAKLAALLPESKYNVLVCGTKEEGVLVGGAFGSMRHVKNLTGMFSLTQYMALINHAQVLVAASTGPLHIAAAFGITAIGLFSEKRPIHPGRWAPLGSNAIVVSDKGCMTCQQGKDCDCVSRISPQTILNLLNERF